MATKKIPYPLVILAGGKGERAGGPKGLIEYNGRPWLEVQIREYRDRGGSEVIVVLGYEHERYFEKIPSLKAERTFINHRPELGQFSSIQLGLSQVSAEAAYVLPVDVPISDESVWHSLAVQLRENTMACVPEWQGRGGHPVLLSRSFINKVVSAPSDDRLDSQIKSLPHDLVKRIAVEDMRVCMNINSLEQWQGFIA